MNQHLHRTSLGSHSAPCSDYHNPPQPRRRQSHDPMSSPPPTRVRSSLGHGDSSGSDSVDVGVGVGVSVSVSVSVESSQRHE